MDVLLGKSCVHFCAHLWCTYCSRTSLVYLFIRLACVSYGRFIAISYKFKLSTYFDILLTVHLNIFILILTNLMH